MTPKGMLAATVGFTVCFACSSTSGGGGLAGSSGAGGSASCNDIVLSAPAVGITYDTNPAPQALGGTIADGTYFMTAQIVYDTASGPTRVAYEQLGIAGTTWQGVARVTGAPYLRYTETVSVGSTTLTEDVTCSSGDNLTLGVHTGEFSADTTGFTVYGNVNGTVVGIVYTKQ